MTRNGKGLKYGWWRREPFALFIGVLAIFLLGALIIWMGLARAEAKDLQPHDPNPTKILVMGDSITHSQAGEFSWRYLLQKQHMTNPAAYDFVGPRSGPSAGASGGWLPAPISAYADDRFDYEHAATAGGRQCDSSHMNGFATSALMATYQPDIVVNSAGINDLAGAGLQGYQLAYCYGLFIQDVQAANPDADIVITKLPWGSTQVPEFNALVPWLKSTYETATSQIIIAEMTGTTYQIGVDTPAGDIHPNEKGERKIATMMAQALEQLGVSMSYDPVQAPATPTIYAQRFGAQVAVWWTYQPQARWVLRCGSTNFPVNTWGTQWITMSQSPSNACKVTAYNSAGYSPWSTLVFP